MNKQRTSDAIRVLERVMTVVPGMTVLSCLEVVCVCVTSSYGTLRNTVDPIGFVCVELANAMPMDCGSIVW